MNLNEMQRIWNSPRNNMPAEEQRTLVAQFTRQMVRRRRFQAVWLTHTFVALTVITILALWSIAAGRTHLEQQWALLPLLAAPWLFAFHFLRRFLKPVSPAADGELPVVGSLRAALESNRSEQSRLKLVGLLFLITIPLLVVSIKQLAVAGKVSPNEMTSMAVFFGATLLLSAAGIAARYFGRLLPQQRQMNDVLAQLTGEQP